MKIIITYFFLLFITQTYGQITLSGIIKSNTNKPLEYVNIGIKNKNIGTISDKNGNFKITLNNSELNELLSFSYIGYEEKQINVYELQKSNFNEIILKESQTVLSEVIVIATKPKLVELGTKSYVSMVAGYVKANNDKNNDIQEFAKEIKIKKPSKILDVNINLFNVFVDTASFRINIYDVKDNLPNNKINTQNIIIPKLDERVIDLPKSCPLYLKGSASSFCFGKYSIDIKNGSSNFKSNSSMLNLFHPFSTFF
tara:strand:+ start:12 stop:776 length:765 start_codon:yes stop_codon:yes gene_type:complete